MEGKGLTETLSVKETAAKLGVHANTVRAWIADGTLPAMRIGHRVLVDRAELDRRISEAVAPRGREVAR
jgi:excisionase family DNA binding protein